MLRDKAGWTAEASPPSEERRGGRVVVGAAPRLQLNDETPTSFRKQTIGHVNFRKRMRRLEGAQMTCVMILVESER